VALIAWDELAGRVNEDGEFRLAARFWNTTLRLDLGSESRRLCLHEGRLQEVGSCDSEADCDLHISAPIEDWERLLAPVPRPFYQDLVAAQLHHGFRMNADLLDYAAYYPALRRLVEILREARQEG
jgi:hypothetical protein